MWALVNNEEIEKIFVSPKSITIGDIQYPSNIFNLWSKSELEDIGLYEIEKDHSNLKNPKFWINTDPSYSYEDEKVIESYGSPTPKDLSKEKNICKDNVDQEAYSILLPFDWYVIRKQEIDVDIPEDISSFRSSVRQVADDMKDKIDNVNDMQELENLYIPVDGSLPIGVWPTPPTE